MAYIMLHLYTAMPCKTQSPDVAKPSITRLGLVQTAGVSEKLTNKKENYHGHLAAHLQVQRQSYF